MGAHKSGPPFADTPRRFVFVWSTRHNASRCHITKSSEVWGDEVIVEAACGAKFDQYDTGTHPHHRFPMCDTCDKERQ